MEFGTRASHQVEQQYIKVSPIRAAPEHAALLAGPEREHHRPPTAPALERLSAGSCRLVLKSTAAAMPQGCMRSRNIIARNPCRRRRAGAAEMARVKLKPQWRKAVATFAL